MATQVLKYVAKQMQCLMRRVFSMARTDTYWKARADRQLTAPLAVCMDNIKSAAHSCFCVSFRSTESRISSTGYFAGREDAASALLGDYHCQADPVAAWMRRTPLQRSTPRRITSRRCSTSQRMIWHSLLERQKIRKFWEDSLVAVPDGVKPPRSTRQRNLDERVAMQKWRPVLADLACRGLRTSLLVSVPQIMADWKSLCSGGIEAFIWRVSKPGD